MDKFEKYDDEKEHLIRFGFLSTHSRILHTEMCLLFRVLTEKYTQNDLKWSILMSIHVTHPVMS